MVLKALLTHNPVAPSMASRATGFGRHHPSRPSPYSNPTPQTPAQRQNATPQDQPGPKGPGQGWITRRTPEWTSPPGDAVVTPAGR